MQVNEDKVERLAEFPKNANVGQFLGKGYEDAVKNANDWAERTGNKCHKYFEQKLITKWHSIIVQIEYVKKENKDEISI